MDIRKVDTNFIQNTIDNTEFQMREPSVWMVEGYPWEKENEKRFCRVPDRILPMLEKINPRLVQLSENSAGGVIRFCTDSTALLIRGRYRPTEPMSLMPMTGQAGFDVTVIEDGTERRITNGHPEPRAIIEGKLNFEYSCRLTGKLREYRIYFPLYAGVEELELGFSLNAEIKPAPPRKVDKPILFYGSSITQGGCASRPFLCHTALISRWADAQQINLGFSGNALGESCIAELIAECELSCFVMDYDFNAPTVEYLAETHEAFYQIIRARQPKLPIVLVSRPQANRGVQNEAVRRRDVILNTYLNARQNGDCNIYFADGLRFFDEIGMDSATVDLVHPNDLGFYQMAKHIYPLVKLALDESEL